MSDKIIENGNNLILLIKSLLNNAKVELVNPDYNEIYKLSKFHSLQNILYYSLDKYIKDNDIEDQININLLKTLTKDNKTSVAKCAVQDGEMELLTQALSENKINYMLLKGSIIRNLYPSADMRSMADIDIYFDKTKHKAVKKIMKELGYYVERYSKGNHDCYMKDPFMNVEMHRDLFSESYEISQYYNDVFSRLIQSKEDPFRFDFNTEDYYIYMIAHSAKHFSGGGTGIRSVIDTYVYLEKYGNELDYDYMYAELDKLGLRKYENNMRKLAYYWFGDLACTPEEQEILSDMSRFIFDSGTYGTMYHFSLKDFIGEETIKNINRSKFKFYVNKIFPSYKHMCARNPIIKKIPILLPWFYMTRILRAIFKSRKAVKTIAEDVKKVNEDEIEKRNKIHDEVGM